MKFLKNNLPIIIFFFLLSIILGLIFSVLIYKGFCKLEQIPDWEKISTIINGVMALSTIGAIFIAIYIPIQDRIISSKINLFETRFETYFILSKAIEDAYIKGFTNICDENELDRLYKKSQYLLGVVDWFKLKLAVDAIMNKSRENDQLKREPKIEDIQGFLDEIREAFSEYLSVNEYGLDVDHNFSAPKKRE